MVIVRRIVSMLAASGLLAGCTSGQSAQLPQAAVPDVAKTAKLQFAVGTATIGIANGASVRGLNVVATFRSADGNNATNTNTPTITGPKGFSFGPLLGNSNVVSGFTTAQYVALENALVQHPETAQTATFAKLTSGLGPYVGVFGYGLAADNRFAIDDSKIQSNFAGDVPFCEGVGFPGYTVGTPQAAGIDFSPAGSAPGSFYGSAAAIVGTGFTGSAPAPTSQFAELERSGELALPIPSGDGKFSAQAVCTCPQDCAPANSALFDPAFPIQAFGGPPAWPSPQGYGNYQYFVGYPTGFTDFVATPVAGTYGLSVSYPTSTDYATSASVAANATLENVAGLAPMQPPVLQIQQDGSGIIRNLLVPAGASETIIFIASSDCDLVGREFNGGSVYFNHYAFVVHGSGPQSSIFVPPNLGPPGKTSGVPTHTFCTVGDVAAEQSELTKIGAPAVANQQFIAQIQAVGFDYPAYESSYPFATSQTPKITGTSGQADVTTSYPQYVPFTRSPPAAGS